MIHRIVAILLVFFGLSTHVAAQTSGEAVVERESSAKTTPALGADAMAQEAASEALLGIEVQAFVGVAGLISDGSQSAALNFGADLGYRFIPALTLSLVWLGRAHPWESGTTLFQTVGPALRWNIWRGLTLEAGGGLALGFVRRGDYQQSEMGGGWFAAVGYRYFFHPNIGVGGRLLFSQRYVKQLYTEMGVVLGPTLAF